MPIILHLNLSLAALAVEALISYPPSLYRKIGHPVTWFGDVLTWADRNCNEATGAPRDRRRRGVLVMGVLIFGGWLVAMMLNKFLETTWIGTAILVVIASSLLAQRSLFTHVRDVSLALRFGGLADGREAVARIVGRDVAELDQAGVARAAIESLAENFADGVVAPLFWLVLLGIPGMVACKIINTADSMIGHRSARYIDFGWAAARLDDAINFLPARLAALLYLALAWLRHGGASATATWRIIRRDARLHRSPNGGWPEAAMAGALGFQLNGPRCYNGTMVSEPVTGDGNFQLAARDIDHALDFYIDGCVLLGAVIAALAFLPG